MANASETAKIGKFITHAKRKWKTKNRSELIDKMKTERTKALVKKFTRKKSKAGSGIQGKEVVRLWKNGILKKGKGKVSNKDLNDFGYLIGSDLLTNKGKEYLIKNVIRRLGLATKKTDQNGASQGDKKREYFSNKIAKFATRGFSGFAVDHGGTKRNRKPRRAYFQLPQADSLGTHVSEHSRHRRRPS